MNVWAIIIIIVIVATLTKLTMDTLREDFVGADTAPGTCKFYGSDKLDGWTCPAEYNTYTGATVGTSSGTFCSGPAEGATCQGFSGVGARVKAVVKDGKITDVKVLSAGANYLVPPVIVPDIEISNVKFQTEIESGKLRSIKVLDGGRNVPDYLPLRVEIADPGYGAAAQAKIVDGVIKSIQITQPGHSYVVAPTISIIGDGAGAMVQAIVNNGHVTGFKILNGGADYKDTTEIGFSSGAVRPTCGFCHMCCKGPKKEDETPQAITKDAVAYHEVIKKREQKEDVRVQQAEKQWSAIEDQLKQEDQTTHEASLLGLPPPPPLHSNADIERAHKSTARKIAPVLSIKEKAYCQRLLRRVDEYKKEATSLSNKTNINSDEVDRAHNLGIKADKLMQIYNKKCLSS
jgi:uncharacterized protein with FMN-binding domain